MRSLHSGPRKTVPSKGEQRDAPWISDFVEFCYKGGALRLHQALSEAARADYELLERASLAKSPVWTRRGEHACIVKPNQLTDAHRPSNVSRPPCQQE